MKGQKQRIKLLYPVSHKQNAVVSDNLFPINLWFGKTVKLSDSCVYINDAAEAHQRRWLPAKFYQFSGEGYNIDREPEEMVPGTSKMGAGQIEKMCKVI